MAKDPRFDRLPCMHRGTYADDCIVNRIQQVVQIYFIFPLMSKQVVGKGNDDDLHWVMSQ